MILGRPTELVNNWTETTLKSPPGKARSSCNHQTMLALC